MPPVKATTSSPYFSSPGTRKSTRVSTTASASAKKRRAPDPPSSASRNESEFDDGEDGSSASASDFEEEKEKSGRKRVKRDQDYDAASDDKGEDDEDESDDDEVKVTIIPLPKLRDEGSVEYEDSKIHENTMLFLKDLKKNNDREWMKFNDGEFRRAQKDFGSFVEELTTLVVEKDATIPELPSKDIIFRIYRDVRFSKEKTPYKAKKGPYAAYYLHLEPGNKSFLGGGLWQPDGPALDCLRTEIDQSPQDLKNVLMNKNLRRDYFPATLKGKVKEKDVVNAFCEKNKENALKTRPRGYDTTHQDINLLRLRSFTIGHKILDSELTNDNTIQMVAELIGSMEPFITYLNSVVMPDRRRNNAPAAAAPVTAAPAADSSDEEEEEGDEEEEEGDEDEEDEEDD